MIPRTASAMIVTAIYSRSAAGSSSWPSLLAQAGLIDAIAGGAGARAGAAAAEGEAVVPDTERAIRADKRLSEDQKSALIVVYRSMLSQQDSGT